MVKDVLIDLGWDWSYVPFILPTDIKDLILATPVPLTNRGADRLVWTGSARGGFDVKSAYKLAIDYNKMPSLPMGWIWKLIRFLGSKRSFRDVFAIVLG